MTRPAAGGGVVTGDDRIARATVEVIGLADLWHRLHVPGTAVDHVDGVGRERQERREDQVQVRDARGQPVQDRAQQVALPVALRLAVRRVGEGGVWTCSSRWRPYS